MTMLNSSSAPRMAHLLAPTSAAVPGVRSSDARTGKDAFSPLSEDPLIRVRNADNPLLEAARPLLRTLAELPALENISTVTALRDMLSEDIRRFQHLCERAGFRREQIVTVRYCLCTALDETANRQPWAKDGIWSDNSLLIQFHSEANGGEKFFLLLGRMAQQPEEHLPVLEVQYHILSLGFQGRYSLMQDGGRQLETIHSRLLSLLLEYRQPVLPELSVHWRGRTDGSFRFIRTLPVWVTATVLGVGLLAFFFMLRNELEPQAKTLASHLAALDAKPLTFVPQTLPVQIPINEWFSAGEQQRHKLGVDTPRKTLRLPGVAFVSGATLHENMKPVLDRVAQRLRESSVHVDITGHTDTVSLRSGSLFKDNQHLSEARAQAVADALIARGTAPERLHVRGKGEKAPLASNKTEEGRTRNRRVELTLREPEPARLTKQARQAQP